MKKMLFFTLALSALLLLSACGGSEKSAVPASSVSAVMEEQMSKADETAPEPTETPVPVETEKPQKEPVDVDLTKLSSTMAYSQLSDMLANPDAYEGKSVRLWGHFDAFWSEDTDITYYSCLVADASNCCMQGLEFELAGAPSRDSYPAQNALIVVSGTFGTYMEGEYRYAQLTDARLE